MFEKRLNEINERKADILKEIDGADEERMKDLEKEVEELEKEEREIKEKMNLRSRLDGKVEKTEGRTNLTEREERAAKFAETNKESINARSLLTSTTGIAKPTAVQSEINDAYGVEVSSIVDMVTVTDCAGMGTYRVPVMISGLEAKEKTDGTAVDDSDISVSYVDLTPNSFDVLSYVSKMLKKQTPIQYETKVVQAARTALRKKASKKVIDAIYSQVKSEGLVNTKEYAKSTTNGQSIDAKTLRDIVLSHGGDEGVGGGVLILNKADLIAFGDVRGTNEKKAIYEITPDAANENTGIIKDGGLSVRYVINSNCTAFAGNKEASQKTMIYGNPKNVEMALWGDIEISTSEDYKFAEGLLSVLGECMLDAAVVVKNGFTVVTTGA